MENNIDGPHLSNFFKHLDCQNVNQSNNFILFWKSALFRFYCYFLPIFNFKLYPKYKFARFIQTLYIPHGKTMLANVNLGNFCLVVINFRLVNTTYTYITQYMDHRAIKRVRNTSHTNKPHVPLFQVYSDNTNGKDIQFSITNYSHQQFGLFKLKIDFVNSLCVWSY